MRKTPPILKQVQGFTLVELAIVLVIIGLIVGGVLVGQDMIKAAQVRSTVGQVEKYNAAINTFRTKFGGMPGDLASDKAASFGLTTRAGTVGQGDGNGQLEGCGAGAMVGGCETLLFWSDLGFANLVDGNFSSATDAFANAGADLAISELPSYLPAAKVGRGNFFTVYSNAGVNYYELAGITGIAGADGAYTLTTNLTPSEAFNMDNKIDNGAPDTGAVIALSDAAVLNAPATAAAPAVGVCVSNAVTPNPYNTGSQAFADSPACQLRFRVN